MNVLVSQVVSSGFDRIERRAGRRTCEEGFDAEMLRGWTVREGRRRLRLLVTTRRGWLLLTSVLGVNIAVSWAFGRAWLPWLNLGLSIVCGVFAQELWPASEPERAEADGA